MQERRSMIQNTTSSKNGIKYQSIPTEYNGVVYRSRVEARWARFFDLVGIKHQYEPIWFTDGKYRYKPDFHLPEVCLREYNQGVFLEVKATMEEYKETCAKHVVMKQQQFVVCIGNPPPEVCDDDRECYQIYPWWDNSMVFCKCRSCGTVKIEYSESNYYQCPKCGAPTVQLHDFWLEHDLPHNNKIFSKKIGDCIV